MKLNWIGNIPGEISKRYEERCKIFANLIEHEPLSCKCPDNIEGGGIQCDVCEVGQTLKVYNDRLKIRSNLSETRPIFPCKCPIIEDVYILFRPPSEWRSLDSTRDVLSDFRESD